jgi:general secretion pathway protein C
MLVLALSAAPSGCGRSTAETVAPDPPKPASTHAVAPSALASASASASASARPRPRSTASAPPTTPWLEDVEVFAWPTTPAPRGKVVRVDATHFLVDHDAAVALVEGQAELLKSARIMPTARDAGPQALRLVTLPASSRLHDFGLEKNDEIESLSGMPLGSPENALEVYAAAKGKRGAFLRVTRAGAPLTLHYRVTDPA